MDFDQEELNEGLLGVSALAGGDATKLTNVSSGAKGAYIKTKINALLAQNADTVARPENGMDGFDATQTQASPRKKAASLISGAKAGMTGGQAQQMESIGLAHLIWAQQSGHTLPANIDFMKADGVISEDEATYLQGVSKFYTTDNIADFNSAVRIASDNTVAAQELAAQQAQQANARSADIIATKAGLQELGYLDRSIPLNADETPELRDGLDRYLFDTHIGLQLKGRAADFANTNLGSSHPGAMWDAMYDEGKPVLKNAAMAREIVATGLEARHIDFAKIIDTDVIRAEALAHAVKPGAEITIDGTLDQATLDTANGFIAEEKSLAMMAGLDNGRGRANPAVVKAMAQNGTLQMPSDAHLDPEQKELLDALGRDTLDGRLYLAELVIEKGPQWYAQGLNKIEQPAITVQVHSTNLVVDTVDVGSVNNNPILAGPDGATIERPATPFAPANIAVFTNPEIPYENLATKLREDAAGIGDGNSILMPGEVLKIAGHRSFMSEVMNAEYFSDIPAAGFDMNNPAQLEKALALVTMHTHFEDYESLASELRDTDPNLSVGNSFVTAYQQKSAAWATAAHNAAQKVTEPPAAAPTTEPPAPGVEPADDGEALVSSIDARRDRAIDYTAPAPVPMQAAAAGTTSPEIIVKSDKGGWMSSLKNLFSIGEAAAAEPELAITDVARDLGFTGNGEPAAQAFRPH